ncbi:hypothetical protein GDO81_004765 [Engystomops pustulosus]|uniref:Uncharacterized protein n=1 Tax=Engystomops pustulosus TaxID=76066 RepID=A0AAV7CI95_ENGPU|nr:hypothetical protein GDO81_004765 [Engystomops pustulosus]
MECKQCGERPSPSCRVVCMCCGGRAERRPRGPAPRSSAHLTPVITLQHMYSSRGRDPGQAMLGSACSGEEVLEGGM